MCLLKQIITHKVLSTFIVYIQFAMKIGMDRTYYASVESGKRNISLQNIEKIAGGFGISISQLFEEL
ncbi:hypothetical protein WA05_03060 [Streptococcus agalactiae]|nr:helix-turn-helix transcriptional regulator [Streptococcus agalactiae]KLL32085.1 hypothetical protein WA02_06995 [Streptococcus agalactiae]KLL85585.1 hypothetical protein WA05_03060 [Streptococcus agalactiae]